MSAWKRARRFVHFVRRWVLISIGLLPFACTASLALDGTVPFRDGGRPRWRTHLESVPTGAAVRIDGEALASPTPSEATLRAPQRPRDESEASVVEMSLGAESSRALVAWSREFKFGTHEWPGDHSKRLEPALDGSIWVARDRDAWRVWMPQDGRIRVAVQTTYYLGDASLDGVGYGIGRRGEATSRWFETTEGLDLSEGEHEIGGFGWRVKVALADRVGLYLEESLHPDYYADPPTSRETIVVTLAPGQFRDASFVAVGAIEQSLDGAGPHAFEAECGVLRFVDGRGRANRVELTLSRGVGLWVKVGAALR